MKRIEAIIRPHKLDEVIAELKDIGVCGVTVVPARGFGRQASLTERYRGLEYRVDFHERTLLLIAVRDEMAPSVVECIISAAKTGEIGDGKVLVSDLEHAFRIRTEESGEDAL